MPRGRPNQGPRLVLIKRTGFREPIWYIRWSEDRRTREHSTGTGDRRSADQIFARWLLEKGCSIEEPKKRGPRRPADTAIDESYRFTVPNMHRNSPIPRALAMRSNICW